MYDWAWEAKKRTEGSITSQLAKGKDGFVFMYDVQSKSSKQHAPDYISWRGPVPLRGPPLLPPHPPVQTSARSYCLLALRLPACPPAISRVGAPKFLH